MFQENLRGNTLDFSLAKQWNQGDVQYIDIDLSIARLKPEEIGLGGRFLGVATLAYDDKYTVSASKTVGSAIISLNENQGEPIELTKGVSYDFDSVFDKIWIRNAAQTGKMMRIMVSSTVRFFPFSSETSSSVLASETQGIKVNNNASSFFMGRSTVTSTSSQIFSSDSRVINRTIKNLGPNTAYLSHATATAASGHPLYVGEEKAILTFNSVNAICEAGLETTLEGNSYSRI